MNIFHSNEICRPYFNKAASAALHFNSMKMAFKINKQIERVFNSIIQANKRTKAAALKRHCFFPFNYIANCIFFFSLRLSIEIVLIGVRSNMQCHLKLRIVKCANIVNYVPSKHIFRSTNRKLRSIVKIM